MQRGLHPPCTRLSCTSSATLDSCSYHLSIGAYHCHAGSRTPVGKWMRCACRGGVECTVKRVGSTRGSSSLYTQSKLKPAHDTMSP
eukprot:scaffold294858_cov13-Tisochrysis_lutea.AAC.1